MQMPRFFTSIGLLPEYNANNNDICCFTQYNTFNSSEILMHLFYYLENKIYAKSAVLLVLLLRDKTIIMGS